MRFLWPADFSQLGEAKIDKIWIGQGLFGKNVYFCGEKGEKHHVVQRNGAT